LSIVACDTSGQGTGEEGSETEGGTDTGGLEAAEADDLCDVAPTLSTGRWPGTLRGAASNLGGACGMGGPDAFVRIAVAHPADIRVQARGVGFEPRVGLLPGGCVEGPELACAQTLPATVDDLPAGSEVVVAVGIDPDDPALSSPTPGEGEPDPLAFEIDVLVRRILAVGDYCKPDSVGRCATGSACLEDAADGAWRCMQLEADTCGNPQVLVLPAETTEPVVIELDPLAVQSDAHHHSCTGARLRERVVRVDLDPGTSATADLIVRVTDPEVGLALRSPGCEADEEIACDAPGASTSVTFPNVGSAAASGVSPFVFVELPDPPDPPPDGGEPPDPIPVSFEVVDG
jgi:hypothetical protein